MAEHNQLISTEKWHIEVMSSIVKAVSDTTLILKGGTALLLIYGLDRFSEDLDFDSQKKIRLEIESEILLNYQFAFNLLIF